MMRLFFHWINGTSCVEWRAFLPHCHAVYMFCSRARTHDPSMSCVQWVGKLSVSCGHVTGNPMQISGRKAYRLCGIEHGPTHTYRCCLHAAASTTAPCSNFTLPPHGRRNLTCAQQERPPQGVWCTQQQQQRRRGGMALHSFLLKRACVQMWCCIRCIHSCTRVLAGRKAHCHEQLREG